MPEWVHVWYWLRSLRHPPMAETLPQQERPPGNPEAMSMDEYELLRQEWVAAGAPKLTQPDALYEAVPF